VRIGLPMRIDKKENLRSHRLYWIGRRTQDIILSALALVALSPVLLLIAVAIMIDDHSSGPIFYQDRVGRNGSYSGFTSSVPCALMQKQSSMNSSTRTRWMVLCLKSKTIHESHVSANSLEKASLDELPQLWNILKGDMSIVGPRPALPREVEQYGEYEMQRLYATPGLSCYWQIAPHRNELSFEEWMDLDVKYLQERSFLVDWKIIFKTFGVCLFVQGE
jgi:lipopolysaccharide/colanic/teichoic acid biosynthesis glycosyltransferase